MIKVINFIKKACTLLSACFLVVAFFVSCNHKKEYKKVSENKILEQAYKKELQQSIFNLDSILLVEEKENKIAYFLKARKNFKKAEPFLAFTDKNNFKSLNAPNILKVEEEDATNIKIKTPFGFQVIEEMLHAEIIDVKKLNATINHTKSRLGLIEKNVTLNLKKYHILWLLRDAIIRVGVTGITGFDSPVLEHSLKESKTVYTTLAFILKTYERSFTDKKIVSKWYDEIDKVQQNFKGSFNDFDRYNFIKNHTHKQLKLLVETQKDWKVNYPFEMVFKNDMTSLFSKETFNIDFFSDYTDKNNLSKEKINLGKQLFNDNSLSLTKKMSCATCHHKDKAFTDGLTTFSKQIRNTPTLTYVSLQRKFFYDGRADNLEGQIAAVVKNENEFHSNLKTIVTEVKKDSNYTQIFNKVYGGKITSNTVKNAIANYMRSLNKFNSKFDNNINNKENTITKSEINGFNLFTGKAKCATCHFAPVFNGTVPPDFTETEFELLGVPKDTLVKTTVSADLGRYNVFKTENRKHFFKTPTIRNVNKTAPYMHNGVYENLHQVIDFYDRGGGVGLGLDLEYQTLPSDKLNLTEKEKEDLKAFMNSLTDQ